MEATWFMKLLGLIFGDFYLLEKVGLEVIVNQNLVLRLNVFLAHVRLASVV